MNDRSEGLRVRLAGVGIFLDEEKPKRETSRAAAVEPQPLDRGKIRRILKERGAHPDDLRWLTISCISVEAAMNYLPWRRDEEK